MDIDFLIVSRKFLSPLPQCTSPNLTHYKQLIPGYDVWILGGVVLLVPRVDVDLARWICTLSPSYFHSKINLQDSNLNN